MLTSYPVRVCACELWRVRLNVCVCVCVCLNVYKKETDVKWCVGGLMHLLMLICIQASGLFACVLWSMNACVRACSCLYVRSFRCDASVHEILVVLRTGGHHNMPSVRICASSFFPRGQT